MCEIIDKAMVLFLRCTERESQNMLQILERAAALLTAEQAFAGVCFFPCQSFQFLFDMQIEKMTLGQAFSYLSCTVNLFFQSFFYVV